MIPFTSIRQIGVKRVRIPAWLISNLREDFVGWHKVAGPFESTLHETSPDLEFSSSAEAEKFILSQSVLRQEAAFSWWIGSRNKWIIAINRGGEQFDRVRQKSENQFVTDSGNVLESISRRGDGVMRNRNLEVQESVEVLLGPSAADSLREKKIDYKKTKAPNFSAKRQPGNKKKRKKT